jgi:hypothetical protein
MAVDDFLQLIEGIMPIAIYNSGIRGGGDRLNSTVDRNWLNFPAN